MSLLAPKAGKGAKRTKNLKKLWKRTRGLTLVKMPLVIKGFERRERVPLPKGGAAKKGEKVPPTVPQIGHFLIIQENRAEKRQSCRSRQNRTNWRTKVALITRDACLSKMQCWFMQLASLVEEKCTFPRNPVPLYLFLLLCKLLDSETAASAVLRFRTQ